MLTNACHITNKIDELYGVVTNNNLEVVMVTESWLSPTIPDSAMTIGNEYTMFRRDRSTPGGGVLAYVHQSIPVSRLTTAEVDDKEVLCMAIAQTTQNSAPVQFNHSCYCILPSWPKCRMWN